jgi:hypothetical protein
MTNLEPGRYKAGLGRVLAETVIPHTYASISVVTEHPKAATREHVKGGH